VKIRLRDIRIEKQKKETKTYRLYLWHAYRCADSTDSYRNNSNATAMQEKILVLHCIVVVLYLSLARTALHVHWLRCLKIT